MNTNSDQALLASASSDPSAFEEFYRRHVRKVMAFAARRCASPAEVADLVAATFVAALDSAHSFDPARGEAVPWLLGVAANEHANHMRRESRERRAFSKISGRRLLEPDDYVRLEEMIDAARLAPRVSEAMAELPDGQRKVLELAGDGLPPREIAQLLGISSATARMRLTRARRAVRTSMKTDQLSVTIEEER